MIANPISFPHVSPWRNQRWVKYHQTPSRYLKSENTGKINTEDCLGAVVSIHSNSLVARREKNITIPRQRCNLEGTALFIP
jgi:hypothetical protein